MAKKRIPQEIDTDYFTIISIQKNLYELQSKNTHHCWIVQKSSDSESCHIKHKYRKKVKKYHDQCNAASLKSAVNKIKKHDAYKIKEGKY